MEKMNGQACQLELVESTRGNLVGHLRIRTSYGFDRLSLTNATLHYKSMFLSILR